MEWGGHGFSMDPRVSGAISSAACWGNRHCYGNNHHSYKFQGVQNRSSHSGLQLWGGSAPEQKPPTSPITWEGTHKEASYSVATLCMFGGETLHSIPPGHGRKQRCWCFLHLKFTRKEWLSFSEASTEEEKSTGDFPGMGWGQRTLKDLQSRL